MNVQGRRGKGHCHPDVEDRVDEPRLDDQAEAVALALAIVVDVVVVLEGFRARSSELRSAA